jgi:hypothetical protein
MSKEIKRSFIFDSVLDKYEKTDEGFIRIPARVTRSGVFLYRTLDGKVIREMRPKEEVFNEDSLKSLLGKVVTNDHPSENVNVNNCKQYQVGFIGDSVAVENDEFVKVSMTITDADTIRDIENGKKELSCGYSAIILDNNSDENYDTIQTNIRYNHVAIVDRGRAGRKVRIDNEDADLVEDDKKPEKNKQEEIQMKEEQVKSDSEKMLFEVQQKEIEKLNNQILDSTSKIKALESELESANETIDKFDSLVAVAANERAGLMVLGEKLGLSSEKLDSLNNDQIKVEYINTKIDLFDSENASSEKISVVFDALKSLKEVKAKKNDSLGEVINDSRKETLNSIDLSKKLLEKKKNNWKKGGNK